MKSCDREGSRAREAGEGGSRLCCIVSISVWKNDGDALRLVEVKELVTVSIGLRCLSMGEESVVGLLQPGWLTGGRGRSALGSGRLYVVIGTFLGSR